MITETKTNKKLRFFYSTLRIIKHSEHLFQAVGDYLIPQLARDTLKRDLMGSKLKKRNRLISRLEILSAGGYEEFERILTE